MGIREEVQASAAAHRELGPGYDTAVAEGLVERIGEEIDRRVDARLFGPRQGPTPAPAPPPPPPPLPGPRRAPVPGRLGVAPVFLALGSILGGIGGTLAVLRPASPGDVNTAQGILVALIWIVIAVINYAYARRT